MSEQKIIEFPPLGSLDDEYLADDYGTTDLQSGESGPNGFPPVDDRNGEVHGIVPEMPRRPTNERIEEAIAELEDDICALETVEELATISFELGPHRCQDVCAAIDEAIVKTKQLHGPGDDCTRGMSEGKLSALQWVIGQEPYLNAHPGITDEGDIEVPF